MSAPSKKKFKLSPADREDFGLGPVGLEAVRLARLGFHVGPLQPGTKNPGSLLGKGWPRKTSNDPRVVADWYRGFPKRGLFLDVGRSGLVVFDFDHDSFDLLPPDIAAALRTGLIQGSRETGDRGHCVFRTKERFSNSAGGFSGFGDVRGWRGAIVLAPTIHPETDKPYRLVSGDWNDVPELPAVLRTLLRAGGGDQKPPLTPKEIETLFAALTTGGDYGLLNERAEGFRADVAGGKSRHEAILVAALRMMGDAKKGKYPATAGTERLRQEFDASFAIPVSGKRRAPAPGEFDGMLAWVAAQLSPEESALELFDATPQLRRVRRWAQEYSVSPIGLLGVGLTRALACLPPSCVLPDVVGGTASLNFFIALVGASGTGKGATERVAKQLFQMPEMVVADTYIGRPGSSEGLAKMFGYVQIQKEGKGTTRIQKFTHTRVLASLAEVDTLKALMGRDDNKLSATLREAWTGSRLGNDYSGAESKFVIGDNRYRFCFVVGVQPDRAETILSGVAGGLPQRFLWLPMTVSPGQHLRKTGDRSDLKPIILPAVSQEDAAAIAAWKLVMSTDADSADWRVLTIPNAVRAQIEAARELVLQGLSDEHEGHRLLTQEKLAMGFAILHGRVSGFNTEHWRMADLLLRVSDETYSLLWQRLHHRKLDARMREAEVSGKVRHARTEAQERELRNQVRQRVLEALEKGRSSKSDLRNGRSKLQREVLDQVLQELVNEGLVRRTQRRGQNGQDQVFYRLRQ